LEGAKYTTRWIVVESLKVTKLEEVHTTVWTTFGFMITKTFATGTIHFEIVASHAE
jgi:hypothetical protein